MAERKALPLYSGYLFSTSCFNCLLKASQLSNLPFSMPLFKINVNGFIEWGSVGFNSLLSRPEITQFMTDMKRSGTSRIFVRIIRDPKGKKDLFTFHCRKFFHWITTKKVIHYIISRNFRKLFVKGKQPGV